VNAWAALPVPIITLLPETEMGEVPLRVEVPVYTGTTLLAPLLLFVTVCVCAHAVEDNNTARHHISASGFFISELLRDFGLSGMR
jgi:hypothetical protein